MHSPSAVVCREVFDENSQPSAEEISEYAQQIGIDVESESHLLPLAKEGLMQALPPPWKAYFDEKVQSHYYFNEDTKKTQWDHPLDNVYRDLVKRARDASIHDDTYVSVQELLTSEENTKHMERVETKVESEDEDLSTDSENNSGAKEAGATLVPGVKRLTPLARPPLSPLSRPLDRKLKDLRISPLRRSMDSSIRPGTGKIGELRALDKPKLFKQQSEIIDLKMNVFSTQEDEDFNLFGVKNDRPVKGLPLTGKGGMFLRVSKSDLPSPDTEKSLQLESYTKSDPPKGILREKLTDSSNRKVESLSLGKPRHGASFEEDKKSVRFKLENTTVEPTISPGSNSSSEQNDGQSSIISATPTPTNFGQHPKALKPLNLSSTTLSNDLANVLTNTPMVLSPITSRPPLPPRPQNSLDQILSPRELSKSMSGSERESLESEPRSSPKRRVIKPPAADYIKQDLFQKNFHKISDMVRPGDLDTNSINLEAPLHKELRPRSPLIPQVNKISINLMESIESETSLDSPDLALDLNDIMADFVEMDEAKNELNENEQRTNIKENVQKELQTTKATEDKLNTDLNSTHSSKLESLKSNKSLDLNPHLKTQDFVSKQKSVDLDDSRSSSFKEDSRTNFRAESLEINNKIDSKLQSPKSPTQKISEIKPDTVERSPWSPISSFKTLNKAVIAPLKSESNSSLSKSKSPRLDGLIISQSKNISDNVVVMYQFESQEEKSKPQKIDPVKDMIERSREEEKRRLELAMQKEIECIRTEWVTKERRMRAELHDELKGHEERFQEEKRTALKEVADRHKKEIEEILQQSEKQHEENIKAIEIEKEGKFRQDVEALDRDFNEKLVAMKEEYSRKLAEHKKVLDIETDRAIAEMNEQYSSNLSRERARLVEANRATIEALRQEHNSRINDLKHDYRAEVSLVRAQQCSHLSGLRARPPPDDRDGKYRALKEKYLRLKHDVKMSIERRNKRREMSMTTGSETEKSNSNKANQSLERCKEANETSVSAVIEMEPARFKNSHPVIKYNDNETSLSESNAQKSENNNDSRDLKGQRSPVSPQSSQSAPRRSTVVFREPARHKPKRNSAKGRDLDNAATTDYQDSSDATTADEKPKDSLNGSGRRRCFTRLKSASTSRLNYSPKRSEGWSSPLEALRHQLRKLDDLEDQFPDLACQPPYSLRYPFSDIGTTVSADSPELEFVRHRALVERDAVRRARGALRDRGRGEGAEERESTELEVALHRARALLGEKEIRLRHIERALDKIGHTRTQEGTTSGGSSESLSTGVNQSAAPNAVLRSLKALHADVRDIWRALDAKRPFLASPDTSSCNVPSPSNPRITLSVQEPSRHEPHSDGSVAERARGLKAWLQTAP